jgi:hypothetical protein
MEGHRLIVPEIQVQVLLRSQNGDNSNKNGKIHSSKMSCGFESCLSPKTEMVAQWKSADLPSQRLQVRILPISQGVHRSTW